MRCELSYYCKKSRTCVEMPTIRSQDLIIAGIALYILICLTAGVLSFLAKTPGYGSGISQLRIPALAFTALALAPIAVSLTVGSIGFCISKISDCLARHKRITK